MCAYQVNLWSSDPLAKSSRTYPLPHRSLGLHSMAQPEILTSGTEEPYRRYVTFQGAVRRRDMNELT